MSRSYKKSLVIVCIVLGILFHFIFYYGIYGPTARDLKWSYPIAWAAVTVTILLYFASYWRSGIKGTIIIKIYDLLILVIFIGFFRSLLEVQNSREFKEFILNPYQGLSLFPVFFFLIGISAEYFYTINKFLIVYCILAWMLSLFSINYFELGVWLLMPIFFIIVTFPLQKNKYKILTLIICVSVSIISITNRAGIMRILISYLIVIIYYVLLKLKVSRKLISLIVFCLMLLPFYFLYLGIDGNSVFHFLEETTGNYGQTNLGSDTRTFLYYEVLQDLKMNGAIIFGKGINGGYFSAVFHTFNRTIVEVGFLQVLLKTGILGFLLYAILFISAIYKSFRKSNSIFMKCLGLLLASNFLMFFIENIIAFNLLNIILWLVIGMCHSNELLGLNDKEIKKLYLINTI